MQMPKLLAEGKTKKIWEDTDPDFVLVESKDDITAGDGARHDILPNKGRNSTRTTSNVFELLRRHQIAAAYLGRISECMFLAERCTMLPYEVVVRIEAHGSYLKRNPGVLQGRYFSNHLVEFYLKTSGRTWNGHTLPCDDPLMAFDAGRVHLFQPNDPVEKREVILDLEAKPQSFPGIESVDEMTEEALRVSRVLAMAWQRHGYRLADFKVEFGVPKISKARVLIADVIDNDSWRLVGPDGNYVCKQAYRNGESLEIVQGNYELVAELSDRFL